MAIGDPITVKLNRALVGFGNREDVITTVETAQTVALKANGFIETYTGPAVPSSVVTHTGGALALDASLANLFVVTLQAAVSSLSITNAVNGQRITVRFVQDATGGRVITARAAPIKTAAGAMPLTAAANAVDHYEFRAIAGVVGETSRALNLS